jgi:hypothetical protein
VLRIGFFRKFLGADALLIDVDHESVAVLERIAHRLASGSRTLDITAEREVIGYRDIVLLAELSEASGCVTEPEAGLLRWSGTPAYWSDVEATIAALHDANAGHQYLEETGAVQVIVSVGEYGPQWWVKYGTASDT